MTSLYSAQEALTGVIQMISDDALAISHQSVKGYREALLKGATNYLSRTAPRKPELEPTGYLALFLAGPRDGQMMDLAELRSTFVEFEQPPRVRWDLDRAPAAHSAFSATRVVYQLHRYPGDRRAFYVDTRVENPAELIKRYL